MRYIWIHNAEEDFKKGKSVMLFVYDEYRLKDKVIRDRKSHVTCTLHPDFALTAEYSDDYIPRGKDKAMAWRNHGLIAVINDSLEWEELTKVCEEAAEEFITKEKIFK